MIISIGESLVDIFCGEVPLTVPGGSPFNVAVAVSKLGAQSGFICPTSTDEHGVLLRRHLNESKVHHLSPEPVDAPTARAEVYTDAGGHPSYTFHRDKTADRTLIGESLAAALPSEFSCLHFGSLTLASRDDWTQWRRVVVRAKSLGVAVSLDPNIRTALIEDWPDYRRRLVDALTLADIVKVSDEDLRLLGESNPIERVKEWKTQFELKLVALTMGGDGSHLWMDGHHGRFKTLLPDPVVDTVGAGDTFQAALLVRYFELNLHRRAAQPSDLDEVLSFAALAANLNCLSAGCAPPTAEQVHQVRAHLSRS